MNKILAFVLLTIAVAIEPFVQGFVIQQLWGWFIVPHFDTKPLTLAVATGIGLLVFYLTHQRRPDGKERTPEEDILDTVTMVARAILTAIVILTFGFIVYRFSL